MDIDEQFSNIIREEMTELEFWNWLKSWLDVADEICDRAENWGEDDKKKFIDEWKKGIHKQKLFPITSVSRDDLEGIGYDASKVDAETMERLASKMADAYCDGGFWVDLSIIADNLEIPLKKKNEKK